MGEWLRLLLSESRSPRLPHPDPPGACNGTAPAGRGVALLAFAPPKGEAGVCVGPAGAHALDEPRSSRLASSKRLLDQGKRKSASGGPPAACSSL